MDLERWFNELTHKYLEVIRMIYLTCNDKIWKTALESMVEKYHEIKSGDLTIENLETFSELIKFNNEYLAF